MLTNIFIVLQLPQGENKEDTQTASEVIAAGLGSVAVIGGVLGSESLEVAPHQIVDSIETQK